MSPMVWVRLLRPFFFEGQLRPVGGSHNAGGSVLAACEGPQRQDVLGADFLAVAEGQGPFDDVFEFTYVTGPGMLHQQVHRMRGDPDGLRRLTVAALAGQGSMLFDEVACQQRDVHGAFAQRRYGQGDDIEPVVEVFAEAPLANQLQQIALGRADQTDVDADRRLPADAFEFLLLNDAQQFDLEVQRDVVDLVDQQAAAVGELEAAGFLPDCTCKSPFFVTEKLAFQHAGL
jgi:hypothetical protein